MAFLLQSMGIATFRCRSSSPPPAAGVMDLDREQESNLDRVGVTLFDLSRLLRAGGGKVDRDADSAASSDDSERTLRLDGVEDLSDED